MTTTDALKACLEALREAREALGRDRTGLASALSRIRGEVAHRMWITEGRGPYEWSDDRYKDEAGDALRTVLEIAKTALGDSGGVATFAVRKADDAIALANNALAQPDASAMERAVLAAIPKRIRDLMLRGLYEERRPILGRRRFGLSYDEKLFAEIESAIDAFECCDLKPTTEPT